MHPALIVNSLGVVTKEDVVTPLLIAQIVGVCRTHDSRCPHQGQLIKNTFTSRCWTGYLLLNHPSMCNRGGCTFVDERTGIEAIDRKRSGDWMHIGAGNGVGKHVAGSRGRLKTASTPTAVDV